MFDSDYLSSSKSDGSPMKKPPPAVMWQAKWNRSDDVIDELMNEPYEYDENSNLNRSPDYNRVSILDDLDD